ncbi:PucR family transcriptional regulator [Paenibacillus sp. H1-7]|uniref:PucR family transcriptional regulator n=1 Tax=Paenibacillus sp. H1-7 TaxID=2282849 RepID=UPI001EF811C9|nr:PucR family transcriptional regulator [Paenibacillus sp. H1-7]ULL15268.1 PucR family transcriptional regulator [Paenibacillus sp. H1-7]
MENAPFTVKSLLELPLFRNAKLFGGHEGLGNEIYYIDSMEMPDLTGWLRPNELILTTGYSFRHEPKMLGRLLDEMHKVGGSAVGIKSRRFFHEIPQEAIEKSNKYHIPLFDIPLEVPFMDMTRTILDQILQRQAYMLRELQEVNQQFTNLVLNRRTSELVVMIGQLLKCEVAVMNHELEMEGCTAHFHRADIAEQRSVRVGNRVFGYLAITRKLGEQDRYEQMCMEHAVTVMAVEFTIRQSQQLQREREQEAFLVELLSGTDHQEDFMRYRATRLGIPIGTSQYAMVIKGACQAADAEMKVSRQYQGLLREINQQGGFARRAIEMNGRILILCAAANKERDSQLEQSKRFAHELIRKAGESDPDVTLSCGIGGIRERFAELSGSYREALKALAIGEHSWSAAVTHYDDVMVEQLLLDVPGHPVLMGLAERLVVPLETYDKEYGTQLLQTLEVYLRTGGNTKRVAEELFIHRNSVLYRLERIREILQIDFNAPETRFRLDLAIRYWRMKTIEIPSIL